MKLNLSIKFDRIIEKARYRRDQIRKEKTIEITA